jgi:hypothetical protein
LLGPNHYFQTLETFKISGFVSGEFFERSFPPGTFTYLDSSAGIDCGLITLHRPLPNIRSITTYVSRSSCTSGPVVRLFRDSSNALHVETLECSDTLGQVRYEYRGSKITLPVGSFREGPGTNFVGLCGSVYLQLFQSEDEINRGGLLFGIHVAGRPAENRWVCSLLNKPLIDSVVTSSCQPEIKPTGFGPISKIAPSENCPNSVPLINKARLGKVSNMPYTGLFAPALLYPAISCGDKLVPTTKFLEALNRSSSPDIPNLEATCHRV